MREDCRPRNPTRCRLSLSSPDLPTNSPRAHYALTTAALAVLQAYGTKEWGSAVQDSTTTHDQLADIYRQKSTRHMVPLVLGNGEHLTLSPSKHHEVQAAVIKDCAPRFAPASHLVYLGDTARKNLYLDQELLRRLNIPLTAHDKLPAIVLFDPGKQWLFLIEVVTSHGPMRPKRVMELTDRLKDCAAGKVFITAFPNFVEFRKHMKEIAWETEV